ncbi:putative acylphosphatase protein [Cryptosporidium serpentis]
MISCDFEVFGKVQGVYFRKYTLEKARQLLLTGWCSNTPNGTVKGQLEGDEQSVRSMVQWLKNEGSPASIIEKCQVSDFITINERSFEDFSIIK